MWCCAFLFTPFLGVVCFDQAAEVSKAQRGLETVCELEAAVRARDTALAERGRELVSWKRLCVVE